MSEASRPEYESQASVVKHNCYAVDFVESEQITQLHVDYIKLQQRRCPSSSSLFFCAGGTPERVNKRLRIGEACAIERAAMPVRTRRFWGPGLVFR